MKRTGIWILALTVVAGILGGAVSAQESKMKNLKVLSGMSDADVQKEMQVWTKALGTRCSHCHQLGDFASDDNEKKEIARKMATMVKTINKEFFNGEAKANCMLCHRGATIPAPEGN